MGEGGKTVSLFKAGKWTNSNKRTEAFATEKDEKTLKNTEKVILNSERHVEHLFAGQNTQHLLTLL